MKIISSLFCASFIASVLVSAAAEKTPVKPAANRAEVPAVVIKAVADRPDPKLLFQLHCSQCHGPKGEGGRGPALAVARLNRAKTDESLVKLIGQGIPGTEMPAFYLEPDQIQQLVGWVRKLGEVPLPQVSGDARRGEEHYLTRGNCATCHAIQGQGGVSGPDLTEIGLRRGVEYLRRSLLEPEADVPENFSQYRWHTVIPDNYLQVRIVTKGRKEVTGARLNEDPFNIQLREVTGQMHSFAKTELAELHKDWGKSPMPSYRDLFSPGEIDDVVAFLLAQRGGGK